MRWFVSKILYDNPNPLCQDLLRRSKIFLFLPVCAYKSPDEPLSIINTMSRDREHHEKEGLMPGASIKNLLVCTFSSIFPFPTLHKLLNDENLRTPSFPILFDHDWGRSAVRARSSLRAGLTCLLASTLLSDPPEVNSLHLAPLVTTVVTIR